MALITGSEILAKCLKKEGVEDLFFLMGGPMLLAESSCGREGIRLIDTRHEQAAAFMAQAYSRLRQTPAVCMAASGPGVANLVTGMANALIDCCPVVAIGGSSPIASFGLQMFQEIDQIELMKGCVKFSDRIHSLKRIPQQVNNAFQVAISGKPGPVYLDFPGDLLYMQIDEDEIDWRSAGRPLLDARPMGDPARIDELLAALARAQRPLIVSGSGVIWSRAWDEMRRFVETAGVPFYTTPQGRGVVPDDHPLSYPAMRSTAFREADLIIVLGTRMNYVIGHAAPPRFAADATIARIDVDAREIASSPRRVDIPIVGDCKAVLSQLLQGLPRGGGGGGGERRAAWHRRLAEGEAAKRSAPPDPRLTQAGDIHPLRLCEEVKQFMDRDCVLVVDGQEILNYGRQSIPTFTPGHRLNSGPFGTMGVGLPFAIGAKIAKPQAQVICLQGDGALGLNAMELDTAIRHKVPLLIVVSLNGGWSADPRRDKPGRDLGYTRFDKICEALGGHGEYVDQADDIGPALRRAKAKVDAGMVALVNVRTDWSARAGTVHFADYST